MNVPHFTTKYCAFFLFSGGENRVTIKYWNGVLAGLWWWQDRLKPLQQQNLIKPPWAGKKCVKLKCLICQNLKYFVSFLDVFLLHTFTQRLSPFVPFTLWHLQWGHIYRTPTLAVHNPLPGQNRRLSVNELSSSLFFQSSLALLTPAPSHLSGEDTPASVIPPGVTEYYTLSATWNMTWRFPCFFLPFFLFCFSLHSNHSKVFAAGHLGSLFVCGETDVLNDDRWQTQG